MNSTEGRQGTNRVNRDRVRIRRTIFLLQILIIMHRAICFMDNFFQLSKNCNCSWYSLNGLWLN